MSRVQTQKRTLGINYTDGKADILVWAPKAKNVAIHWYSNGGILPLEKKDLGYWSGCANAATGDTYRFVVDGKELPDPASLYQPEGVHGPSAIADLHAYNWTDQQWVNPPLEEHIFYELHTGTFTDSGTFAGIEEKLDHLLACGITAIEIMPVSQFPGGRNWGYDGVFPFAVQDSYGGPQMLQHLVDKCHDRGLAVVLDVVYNHLGPEGNYLGNYGPYFTDKYKTPWGSAVNFDDAYSDEVRRFFIENVLMWFRDFHIDALRMDAVHAIRDFGAKHLLQEIREHVDVLMADTGRLHYLIVECDLNDTRYINSNAKSGYGMDAQWMDEFHHALRVSAGQKREGYYTDFNGVADLAKSYKDAYVFDGVYSPERIKTFGNKADGNPGRQFIVFSQNHDQTGNRMLGERTSTLVSYEMLKLLAGAVLISPFLPLLFMGEEWGAQQPFQYFISHTDPDLVTAVRKGRKAEFASFNNQGEAPDPQAQETFDQCKLQWQDRDEATHKNLLKYYTALIALRKTEIALRSLNRKLLYVKANEEKNVLTLRRWHGKRSVACYLNFSKNVQTLTPIYPGHFEKIFDSANTEYGGPCDAQQTVTGQEPFIIQPESLLIYLTQDA